MIQGDLAGIPLAEVIQLVATTRRTGTLYVVSTEDARVFRFRAGELISASSLEQRFRLGVALCQKGLITPALLDDALLDQKRRPGRALGDVLLARGWISMDALRATLRVQIQDALDDAIHWQDGGFLFAESTDRGGQGGEVGEKGEGGGSSAPGGVSFVVQPLLFESLRKLDEWARFSRLFQDRNAIVAFNQDQQMAAVAPGSDDALAVLESVDGRRTISQIVARSTWSEHRVVRGLATLMDVGLVRLAPPTDSSKFTQSLFQDKARPLTVAPRAGARAVAIAAVERGGVIEMHAAALADPGLAVAVLRAATSIGAKEGAQFATIRDAVLALGEDVLRRVLVAAGLRGQYSRIGETHSVDLWRHSLVTALASARIAGALGMPAERAAEAYLCGLLHDVGAMILRDLAGSNYEQIEQAVAGGALRADAERRVLGVSHEKVGAQSLERWGAAPSVIEVAHSHHRGLRGEPWQLAVVQLADAMAAHAGYDAESLATAGPSLERVSRETVDLPPEELQRVLAEVTEEAGVRDPLW